MNPVKLVKNAPSRPSIISLLSSRLVLSALGQIKRGQLRVDLPDGSKFTFGDRTSSDIANISFVHWQAFTRLIRDGGIGLGEGFVEGDWSSDDLATFLRVALNNWDAVDERKLNLLSPVRFLHRLAQFLRKNSLRGSAKNISAHYDLSNEMFQLFLDESMMYSSGIYNSPDETLEQAQINKLDTIIAKAHINSQCHVLEIGSGWGSFAIRAAQQTGCRVTTLTLSQEQLNLSNQRITQAGLNDRIEVKLCDYRKMTGSFDRIVSIEMLEAVGRNYLKTFFETCDNLLNPAGIAVIQVITMPDSCYAQYNRRADWIQKYIFPGSHLPSLGELQRVLAKHTDFVVEDIENIAPHYARTLAEWRIRFTKNWPAIERLGFDERFKRIWLYYLCSCEAEFGTRWLGDHQIVLTRSNNQDLVGADRALMTPLLVRNAA
jgi:cyclopropane-fatty-acyl-phospholipid synthase